MNTLRQMRSHGNGGDQVQSSTAQKFIARAFSGIVALWPADTRGWALAMQAELCEMNSTRESLRWLAGGTMSLGKAWWNRVMFGGSSDKEKAPARMPGISSAILLLAAIAVCALPSMRQGLLAVFDTVNVRQGIVRPAQLEQMGRTAEQEHDAQVLALAAMRLPEDSPDKNRWADMAVSLDPSLAWIYFQMQQSGVLKERTPIASERIARLQKWDPDNAVPYLMEADQAFARVERTSGRNWQFNPPSAAERTSLELAKDPQWSAAMDKAFRASHYDTYQTQRFNLDLAVQQKLHVDRPIDLMLSTAASKLPNFLDLSLYSIWLMHDGAQREAAGDSAGAVADYWRVAQFSQRIEAGTSEDAIFERSIANGMMRSAFEKLQGLLAKTGRPDEARYVAFELDQCKAERAAMMSRFRAVNTQQNAIWADVSLYFSAGLILITGLLSGISLLWLAVGAGGAEVAHATLRKWACAIGRFAPVLLAFSVVMFYLNYFPFLEAFRNASPENILVIRRTFSPLLQIPFSVTHWWTYGRGAVYFWSAASLVGCASVLFLIVRMSVRGKLEKSAA